MFRQIIGCCALVVFCSSASVKYKEPQCPNGEWTPFFDRDNPGGYYDWEHLTTIQAENPGKVCPQPVAVDARLVATNAPYYTSGEVVIVGPTHGLTCKNEDQTDRKCQDYKVRFCCQKQEPQCPDGEWTPFFDRDNPGGYYDWEHLTTIQAENPGKVCPQPVAVDARLVATNAPYYTSGEVVIVGPTYGLTCKNEDQTDRRCQDYKVRFCCQRQETQCPENAWTDWFDRDDSSGYYDYEALSDLQTENPGKICPAPSAIDARLVSTNEPYWTSGEVVTVGPLIGLVCKNSDQTDKRCEDYKVRFCCFGESTCPSNQWTQWFDRDNPGGYYDWEGLGSIQAENPMKVCPNPTAVDARLVGSGAPYTDGNDVVSVGPSIGLTCENAIQDDKRCNDYEVRFCCAGKGETPWCPGNAWTGWFDRDNPSGGYDWEALSALHKDYPGKICKNPTAVDAQLTTGAPYTDGGDSLILSASQGLICENAIQTDKECEDYRVRFCCPGEPDQKVRPLPADAQPQDREATQLRSLSRE